MAPRHPTLRDQLLVVGSFGSEPEPPGSAAGIQLAPRLGASAVSLAVLLDPDNEVVLRGAATGLRLRRRNQPSLSLTAALDLLPAGVGVVLLADEPDVADAACAAAIRAGRGSRLWFSHPAVEVLTDVRQRHPAVQLVHQDAGTGPGSALERRLLLLRSRGIEAIHLPATDWTGGNVKLVHRFGREAWAGEPTHLRSAAQLIHAGVDAVSSRFVDRVVDAARLVDSESAET
jgi:hypothetical protein